MVNTHIITGYGKIIWTKLMKNGLAFASIENFGV